MLRKKLEQSENTILKFQSIRWYSSQETKEIRKDFALITHCETASHEQFLLDFSLQYWIAHRQLFHPSFHINNNSYTPLFVILSPYTQNLESFLQQLQLQNLASVPLQIIADDISSSFPVIKLQDIKLDLLSNISNISRDEWKVFIQEPVAADKNEIKTTKPKLNSDMGKNLRLKLFNYASRRVEQGPIPIKVVSTEFDTSEEQIIEFVSNDPEFEYNPEEKTYTPKLLADLFQSKIFKPTMSNLQKSTSMYISKAFKICKLLK